MAGGTLWCDVVVVLVKTEVTRSVVESDISSQLIDVGLSVATPSPPDRDWSGSVENSRRGGKLGRHDALVVAVDKAGVPHSNDTNHHTLAGCPTHGEAPGPLDVHLQPGIQHRVHMAPAVVSLRIPETVLVVPLVVEDQGLDGARVVIPT